MLLALVPVQDERVLEGLLAAVHVARKLVVSCLGERARAAAGGGVETHIGRRHHLQSGIETRSATMYPAFCEEMNVCLKIDILIFYPD